MTLSENYPLEWLRQFMVHRTWLQGTIISEADYVALRERQTISISQDRLQFLKGYVQGWVDRGK
jgi:hypothetical protein